MQVSEVPGWLRKYMIGASQELYELAHQQHICHLVLLSKLCAGVRDSWLAA
jgi:hypothetical protein